MLDRIGAKRHKVQQLMIQHHHSPHDLTTRAGRKALRHDMRMVAVRPRRWGLWLLAAGALMMVLPSALDIHSLGGWSPSVIGLALIAVAVPLLIGAAILRRRYRRGLLMIGGPDRQ